MAALLLGPPSPAPAEETLTTPPLRVEVLDGLRLRDIETGTVYRLYGIATCAADQRALLGRQPWPCGTMATAWLVTATLTRWIACRVIRDDGEERLARCASAEHRDLAADLLHDGLAVVESMTAQDPAVRAYATAEHDARLGHRGLWSGTMPKLRGFNRPAEASAPDPARTSATSEMNP